MARSPLIATTIAAALVAVACAAGGTGQAADAMAGPDGPQAVSWDLAALAKPPRVYPAPGHEAPGVEALFYEGLPWNGKPTRVFAWYGVPADPTRKPFPAMVLVHGGGGTAFAEWVRLWTARGYAAISMDTCGCTAGGEHMKRPRHDLGGPPGWGGFDQIDLPPADQWMYHAVADCLLAVSLLESRPEVDGRRIGLTGISWGGVVACIAAGVDPRLKCVVPVYGCGNLGAGPNRLIAQLADADKRARWLSLWDPSNYLPAARVPMLWVSGTNDTAFPLPLLQKSYRQATGRRTLAIRVNMVHTQEAGAAPDEIAAFADHHLRGGPPLPQVTGQGAEGRVAWVALESARPPARVELVCTQDGGDWPKRRWRSLPADLEPDGRRASAVLPEGTTAWMFNIFDEKGRVVSSEHVEASRGQ